MERAGARRAGARGRFASRAYRFDLPSGGALRVVNDATIPPADGDADLGRDVIEALEGREHCLICANRGVLLAEARRPIPHGAPGRERAARTLVAWLLRGREVVAGAPWHTADGWMVTTESESPPGRDHYAFARIEEPDAAGFDVHVVFMDRASLLEPAPDRATTGGPGRSLEIPPLIVDPIRAPALGRRQAAFLVPLRSVAKHFEEDTARSWPGGRLDPVWANVRALQADAFADSWCRVMRAAEVQGGSHFTYRDLWALAILSIVGPSVPEKLAAWVSERAHEAEQARDETARLRALASLAQARTHISLFGGLRSCPPFGAPAPPGARAVIEAMERARAADPLLDFDPGFRDDRVVDVLDRLSQIEDGGRPGGDLAADDEAFFAAWSPLDSELEDAVAVLVDPAREDSLGVDRRAVLRWYGQYMFRLIGLATGRPAFGNVVDKWQAIMRRALRGQPLLPDVGRSLKAVVLPTRPVGGEERTYLPLLRSRVVQVAEEEEHVAIRVDPGDFRVEAPVGGDGLLLRMFRAGEDTNAAETSLDFHLLREALARAHGRGFTGSLRAVEPRLERLRARVLAIETGREAAGGPAADVVFAGREIIQPG